MFGKGNVEVPVSHPLTTGIPAFLAASLPYPSPPGLFPFPVLIPAVTAEPRFTSPLTCQLPTPAHPWPRTAGLRGGDPCGPSARQGQRTFPPRARRWGEARGSLPTTSSPQPGPPRHSHLFPCSSLLRSSTSSR